MRFTTLMILCFSLFQVHAQSQMITVVVKDLESREPLVGANVFLDDAPAGASDINGELTLDINERDHVITASYIGYDDYERAFTFFDLEGPNLEILMKPTVTLLNAATVTGTRYEKPLAESTVSIDVLSSELITRTAAPDIEEVLNRMPGVQMLDGQANIRGGSGWSYGAGSRVLLLLDDIPILQVDAAIPNWSDVPLENIGRVEILKGASSALYGSSALNGIINIKTDYAKSEPETFVNLQGTHFLMPVDSTDYGFRYESQVNLIHRQKFDKLDVVFGGAYVNEADYRIGDELEFGRINLNLRYRIKDNLVVGLNSLANPGRSKSYFYWDDTNSFRGDTTSFTTTDRLRFNIDPYVKWDVGNFTHKLLSRLYRTSNQSDNDQSNASWMTYAEYQMQYRHQPSGINISAGAVLTNTEVTAELYSDSVFTNRNIAAYAQIERRFWDKLTLNAGVRLENNLLKSPMFIDGDTIPNGEIEESRPVVRFGANYQLASVTYLRASWGQGYRFPSIAEKFINTQAGGIRVRPNVNLESEFGWSGELGLRQGFGGDGWNGYVDAAYFWSEYDDMMEFSAALDPSTFTLFFQSQNVGGTIIKGLEVNTFVSADLLGIETGFQAGYTYIDPQFKDFDESGNGKPVTDLRLSLAQRNAAKSTADENVLKYRSKHNFKFDIQLQKNAWFGGIGFNYVSELLAFDRVLLIQVPGLLSPQEDDMDGYQTVDFRLGYAWDFIKIQAQLKNAFDERYSARPGYLEAPRNITLRLGFSF